MTTLDRDARIAEVLPNYRRWLYRLAYDMLPDGSPDHDDLANEGYIAMWRAFDTYDETKGALPSWLTGAARLRMRDLTSGHGQWFGHEPVRGHREVETSSLDAYLDETSDDLSWLGEDLLDGVEIAYHYGQIHEALATLSPSQREYVFARFWLGIDPSSQAPAMQAFRDAYPVVRRGYLWRGSSKQKGARDRLAEALADLVA